MVLTVSRILFPHPEMWISSFIYAAYPSCLANHETSNFIPKKAGYTWHFNPKGLSPHVVTNMSRALLPHVFTLTLAQPRRYLFCDTFCIPNKPGPHSFKWYGALCCPDFPPPYLCMRAMRTSKPIHLQVNRTTKFILFVEFTHSRISYI